MGAGLIGNKADSALNLVEVEAELGNIILNNDFYILLDVIFHVILLKSLCKEYTSSQHSNKMATVPKLPPRWLCKKKSNGC